MTTEETPVTMPAGLPAEPVVPEGKHFVDNLTLGELDTASRKLGTDVVDAVTNGETGLRWRALAYVAWLWHKRTDKDATLDQWLTLCEVDHITYTLRKDDADAGDDDEDGDDEDAFPTD